MDEMLKELERSFNLNTSEEKASLIGKYDSFDLSLDRFHPISKHYTKKSLCFIDGGSSLLVKSPSLCLGLVRGVGVVMKSRKTKRVEKYEYYVLAKTRVKGNNMFYDVSFFPLSSKTKKIEGFSFDSRDSKIVSTIERFDMSSMIDASRRFLELNIAREMSSDLESGDMIILDGNLRATYPSEESVISKTYESCIDNGVLLLALSKTSNLMTSVGDTLVAKLHRLSLSEKINEFKRWFYYPAFKSKESSHNAETYFLKLHQLSDYIFTLDILKDQNDNADVNKVMGLLAIYSRDAAFPGYPYGLIKADSLARVTNSESDMFLTRLSHKNQKLFKLIKPYVNSLGSHSVLDNMEF